MEARAARGGDDELAAEGEVVVVDGVDDPGGGAAEGIVGHAEGEDAVRGLVGEEAGEVLEGEVAGVLVVGIELVDGGAGEHGVGPQLRIHGGDEAGERAARGGLVGGDDGGAPLADLDDVELIAVPGA